MSQTFDIARLNAASVAGEADIPPDQIAKALARYEQIATI